MKNRFELAPDAFDTPIMWIVPPVVDGSPPAQLQTTSISRCHQDEACPRRLALNALGKIPEPERPGPSPLERGSQLHEYVERYITGQDDELHPDVTYFRDDVIKQLRARWETAPDSIMVENSWRFNRAWEPVADNDWDNTWLFIVTDVMVLLESEPGAGFDVGVPIDWKSGKKEGNEIKHTDQMTSYTLASFAKFDTLNEVTSELFYIDKNESMEQDMTRRQAERLRKAYTTRLARVTDRTEFPPRPSKHTCRFCAYKTGEIVRGVFGTGHCRANP